MMAARVRESAGTRRGSFWSCVPGWRAGRAGTEVWKEWGPWGRGFLSAQFRERTEEAKKNELANEYVRGLADGDELQDCLQHTDWNLVSAILMRVTAPAERTERDRNMPQKAGMTLRRKNLHAIVHESPPSSSDASGRHRIYLRRYALMGRPAGQYTYPVAPFDNNLALLRYRLEKLHVVSGSNKFQYLFPNELDFYNGADNFILAAIIEHTSEEERMDAPRPFFEAIFFGKDLKLEYKVA
ncbi:hypothetical protein BJ912DRAFT_181681 [Pholiota molesta]|nr:hypothetical protein BJ912DRAFT_181681 [Pholiota molesta]